MNRRTSSEQQLDALLRKAHVLPRPGEHKALAYYVSDGYRVINDALRSPKCDAVSSGTKRQITLLDMAIERQVALPHRSVLWRGIRAGELSDRLRLAQPGDFFIEPAFTSATTRQHVGEFFGDGLVLQIEMSSGIRAVYVPPTGIKTEESEILLLRGIGYEVRNIGDNVVEVTAHGLT
jgi:hypothetical protein